jgi:hypothetical protein
VRSQHRSRGIPVFTTSSLSRDSGGTLAVYSFRTFIQTVAMSGTRRSLHSEVGELKHRLATVRQLINSRGPQRVISSSIHLQESPALPDHDGDPACSAYRTREQMQSTCQLDFSSDSSDGIELLRWLGQRRRRPPLVDLFSSGESSGSIESSSQTESSSSEDGSDSSFSEIAISPFRSRLPQCRLNDGQIVTETAMSVQSETRPPLRHSVHSFGFAQSRP